MALPEIITVEDLFTSPVRAGASISPDGTKIAYLAPWKDRLNVWVQGVDSDDDARCVTADDNRSVLSYQLDRRSALAAVHPGQRRRRELARVPGRPGEPGRSRRRPHAVPRREGASTCPPDAPARRSSASTSRKTELFDAYELDIATGDLTLLAENPGHGASWFSSRNGELFALALTARRRRRVVEMGREHRHAAFHRGVRRRRLHAGRLPDRGHTRTGPACGSAPTGTPTGPVGSVRRGHRRGDGGRQPPDVQLDPRHTSGRPSLTAHPQPADRGTARRALSR